MTFEELYTDQAPHLRSWFIGHGARAVADDLAQDTFYRALRAWHQYDQARPVMPWLQTIARNVLYQHWRYQSTDKRSGQRVPLVLNEPAWAPTLAPDYAEELDLAQAAFDRLPPDQQNVLKRYFDGQSDRAIAKDFGVSSTLVRRIRVRALDQLAKFGRRVAA